MTRTVPIRLSGTTPAVVGWPTPIRRHVLPQASVLLETVIEGQESASISLMRNIPDLTPHTLLRNVTASMAHDLANMLCVMGVDVSALEGESISARGRDAITPLREEILYLRGLTEELRMAAAESATPAGLLRQTRLTAWWPDVRALLRAMHGTDVIIHAHIPWGLPALRIAPQHLTQIFVNIVGNAAHAIVERAVSHSTLSGPPPLRPYRGKIHITAHAASRERFVVLSITDNGVGMSPAVLARMGESHFTTRGGRGGTGLGLTIVQQLVSAVGGWIHHRSNVSSGTIVTIALPASSETNAPPDEMSPP